MPFSIQFLGVGSAFSMPTTPGDLTTAPMQSNMVITAANGKKMLFDCGTDIRFSAQMCGYGPGSFDAVYISHEHADHMGGLEWLLLNRLFANVGKLRLLAQADVLRNVWKMLQPSLQITTKGKMSLTDYVDYESLHPSFGTDWEELRLGLVPVVHVACADMLMMSYGMCAKGEKDSIYISSDTLFNSSDIIRITPIVDIIFHDCEVGFKTGVHAHYDQLLTLPDGVRAKMWLYHYNPVEATKKDAVADGFRGFVTRGQIFHFD